MENSRIYHKIYDPVPYLIIENTFNQQELELVWEELKFLNYPGKLLPPSKTKSAQSPDGKPLKNNKAVFLNTLFLYNNISNILKINQSILCDDTKRAFSSLNFGYNSIWTSNNNNTLLNYYHDGDYYKPHKDNALQTFITFFYKEPKQFSGGDFWITEHNHKIEIKNNMTIAIPSFLRHHVDTVKMKNKVYGNGRYSMTIFTLMR